MSIECLNEFWVEEVQARLRYSCFFSWLNHDGCWWWAWEEPLPGENRSTDPEGSLAKTIAVFSISQASIGVTFSKSPQIHETSPCQGLSRLSRRLKAASPFVWDADWGAQLKTYFVHAEHTHPGFHDSPKESGLVLFRCSGPIPTSPVGQVGGAAKPGAAETPWGAHLFMPSNEKRKQILFSPPALLLFIPLVPLHLSLSLSLCLSESSVNVT